MFTAAQKKEHLDTFTVRFNRIKVLLEIAQRDNLKFCMRLNMEASARSVKALKEIRDLIVEMNRDNLSIRKQIK